jgi:glc operon protein GlcG
MFWKPLFAAVLFCFSAGAYAQDDGALAQQEVLTLPLARAMVAGCEDFARKNDLAPLTIAIYDASGNLKLFSRQDGSMMVTVEFAHIKARTAAVLGMSTKNLGDNIEFANNDRPMGLRYVDNLTVVQGGIPIRSQSGQLLGGMGVSGAPSAMDEACGWAGIDAVKGLLKKDG